MNEKLHGILKPEWSMLSQILLSIYWVLIWLEFEKIVEWFSVASYIV